MTKKPQPPFSVRLDQEMLDRIGRLAEKQDRSMGNMVKVLLSAALDVAEKRK